MTPASSEIEAAAGRLCVGDLTIDYDRRRVVRLGAEIRLTPKEFELLSLLARHADCVLTHRKILTEIWGANAVDQPQHVWVLVRQLRRKIEVDPRQPQFIRTVHGDGYCLNGVSDDSVSEGRA